MLRVIKTTMTFILLYNIKSSYSLSISMFHSLSSLVSSLKIWRTFIFFHFNSFPTWFSLPISLLLQLVLGFLLLLVLRLHICSLFIISFNFIVIIISIFIGWFIFLLLRISLLLFRLLRRFLLRFRRFIFIFLNRVFFNLGLLMRNRSSFSWVRLIILFM